MRFIKSVETPKVVSHETVHRSTRDNSAEDRPRVLELHHLEHHARGGANSEDNLIVLCSKCHDEVHAGRLVERPSSGGEISFVPAASLEQP